METRVKFKPERVYNDETHRWETRRKEVTFYRYTDDEKMQIVAEHIHGASVQSLVEKYHLSCKNVLLAWIDKFVNAPNELSLPENQSEDPMAKKNPDERIRELEAENKRLEKALELEKLRAKAYDTMINVAEETFNIPIRKKSGTKR